MATPDVTVMGGGIFGLAAAWAMTRRGARVRVIECERIGAGSSGGLVGALAPHVPEAWNPKKQFQFESLIMAEAFWAGVAEAGGQETGYARNGRLQPVADAAALDKAHVRAAGASRLWQGRAEWTVVRATAGRWEPASASGWLVHDTLSARIAPRQALAALAEAIVRGGGEIVIGAGTARGRVLWATGVAGLAALSADLGWPVGGGVKGQAALLACDAAGAPQIFADGLHVVPHSDGTVAIGSTTERDFAQPPVVTAALDDVIARARAAVPALAGAPVIARWAGLRPRAASRAPMLGAWPGRADHFVANGGFKIGFGMAPKVAEVMADLMLDGRDAIPAGFRIEDSLGQAGMPDPGRPAFSGTRP